MFFAALVVVTVNYPLQYMAERIGGPDVQAVLPVPADEDPAFWEPSKEELSAVLAKADLVLDNGAGYAPWLPADAKNVVDTSAAFQDRLIGKATSVEDDHHARRLAFTTWMDLGLAARHAEAVRDALVKALPEKKAEFDARLVTLREELLAVDTQISGVFAKMGDEATVLTSHPVYDYFLRAYGVKAHQLHWEPEERPSDAAFQTAAAAARKEKALWMLWEGVPLAASVARLERAGVRSVTVDPCANKPEAGDFLTVMRANADALKKLATPTRGS